MLLKLDILLISNYIVAVLIMNVIKGWFLAFIIRASSGRYVSLLSKFRKKGVPVWI